MTAPDALRVVHAAWGADEFGNEVLGLFQDRSDDPEGSLMVIVPADPEPDETYAVVVDGGPSCDGGIEAVRPAGPREHDLVLTEDAATLLGVPAVIRLSFACSADVEAEAVRRLQEIAAAP